MLGIEMPFVFVQYLGAMISVPDIRLPINLEWFARLVQFASIVFYYVRDFLTIFRDPRLYFTTVAVLLPIALFMGGVVMLNPFRVIVWYAILLVGACSITASAFLVLLTRVSSVFNATGEAAKSTQEFAVVFGIVGAGCLVACGVGYLLSRLCKAAVDKESAADTVEKRMADETKTLRRWDTLFRMITFVVCCGAGGLAVAGSRWLRDNVAAFRGTGSKVFMGVGIALFVVGVFAFVWMCVGCTRCGRVLQWRLGAFLENNFMKVLLIGMSIAYVPVGASVFRLFNCNEFVCPSGTTRHIAASMMPATVMVLNGTTSAGAVVFDRSPMPADQSQCFRCAFTPSDCPVAIKRPLCQAESTELLEGYREVECGTLRTLYWPAAVLVILFYMIGIPAMMFVLIREVTRRVSEFPVAVPQHVAADSKAKWEVQVLYSDNAARFLYQPFVPTMRYARLILTVHKLLVVFTSVFIIRLTRDPGKINGWMSPPLVSLYLTLGLHIAALAFVLVMRPFIQHFENMIFIGMQCLLIATAAVLLTYHAGAGIPDAVLMVVAVVNIIIAVASAIVGIVLECYVRNRMQRAMRDERERKLRERVTAADEEEERKEQQQAQEAQEAQRLAHEIDIIMAALSSAPGGAPQVPPRAAGGVGIAVLPDGSASLNLGEEVTMSMSGGASPRAGNGVVAPTGLAMALAAAAARRGGPLSGKPSEISSGASSLSDSAGSLAGLTPAAETPVPMSPRNPLTAAAIPEQGSDGRHLGIPQLQQHGGASSGLSTPTCPSPAHSAAPGVGVAPPPMSITSGVAAGPPKAGLQRSSSAGGAGNLRRRRSVRRMSVDEAKLALQRKRKAQERADRRQKLRAQEQERLLREEQQLMALLKVRQSDYDLEIDTAVRGMLRIFLMLFGIIACVALGFCAAAFFEARGQAPMGPVAPVEWQTTDNFGVDVLQLTDTVSTTTTQLAGHGSWAAFAASCCCTYSYLNVTLNPPTGTAADTLAGIGVSVNLTANATAVSQPFLVEHWLCQAPGSAERVVRQERIRAFIGEDGAVTSGALARQPCAKAFNPGYSVKTGAGGTVALHNSSGEVDTSTQLFYLW